MLTLLLYNLHPRFHGMARQNPDLTESRQSDILIVAWVTTSAALITVAIKIFTRLRVVKVIGWDDFFVVFSMVRMCEANFEGIDP